MFQFRTVFTSTFLSKAYLSIYYCIFRARVYLQYAVCRKLLWTCSALDLWSKTTYTLLQKKCTLISSSFPADPGSLTPTPGHFKFVKWSWEKYAKDPVRKLHCKFWHRVFCVIVLWWFSCAKHSEKSVHTITERTIYDFILWFQALTLVIVGPIPDLLLHITYLIWQSFFWRYETIQLFFHKHYVCM